jgi:hypothetical protein
MIMYSVFRYTVRECGNICTVSICQNSHILFTNGGRKEVDRPEYGRLFVHDPGIVGVAV